MDNNFQDRYVCVLGLGYVGLTLATAMADVGFKVLGVEIRDHVLDGLKKGKPHFFEPGLESLTARLNKEKSIKYVKRIPRGSKATVFIITVGTPLGTNGKARLDMVESMSREVAQHLKNDDLVIVRSTMKIGTTRKVVLSALQKKGVRFELAFCPERTLEGRALLELRQNPQIVGGHTPHAAMRAAQIFQFLTPTVVQVSDMETAEMVKLIDNASRDVQFAYANEVARICDAVGVSAVEVIRAGKLSYPRTNVPLPGPVGGPCLEKDPYILAEGLKELGVDTEITLACRKVNERQPAESVAAIARCVSTLKNFPKKPVITLMGLAFKGQPATDDLRGTMAKSVLTSLRRHFPGAVFRGYDPVVPAIEIKNFGLKPVAKLSEAFNGSSLVLLTNNHLTIATMPIEKLAMSMKRPGLIYDFWNMFRLSAAHLPKEVGYMALGSHGKAILPSRRS